MPLGVSTTAEADGWRRHAGGHHARACGNGQPTRAPVCAERRGAGRPDRPVRAFMHGVVLDMHVCPRTR